MKSDPPTYAVIGAALALEFAARQIPFTRQAPLSIHDQQRTLMCTCKADFICFNEVLVELKALARLGGSEEAPIQNYWKASGLGRGLLFNFGAPSLEHQRFIFTPRPQSRPSVKSVNSADISPNSADVYRAP